MDRITPEQRSANMRAIRSKDTAPERRVREVLRAIGYSGYRLHRKDLPGRPDIAFVGRKKAIFVHGCFWHGHDCRQGVRRPKSGQGYWPAKIEGNRARDERHAAALSAMGWQVLVLWDCELSAADLGLRLKTFMSA